MKLYEITSEIENLDLLLEELIDLETGEVIDGESFEKTLEAQNELQEIFKQKAESIVKYSLNIDSDLLAMKEEIKRLKTRMARLEKKKEWLLNYLLSNMEGLGITKLDTPLGSFKVGKSKRVILNESLLKKDPRYWTEVVTNKFDKNAIKKILQTEAIEGASIEEHKSLKIK